MLNLKVIDEAGEISTLLNKLAIDPPEQDDLGQLVQWTRQWLCLKDVLEKGTLTYKQLKTVLLGSREPEPDPGESEPQSDPETEGDEEPDTVDPDDEPTKKPGHGRKGVKEYKGCRRQDVFHESLKPGDDCPECVAQPKGRLCFHKPGRPLKRLRLTGSAPITGTVYQGYPLCCSKCGAYFAPNWPQDAHGKTYDASAKAMIALMRHWYGFPSYRLERLQREMGIPVPDATQADHGKVCAHTMEPVFHALFRKAAHAMRYTIDDTSARIQSLNAAHKKHPDTKRYGAHVTGIIAHNEEHDIYLYRIGMQHAGENLEDLLAHRPDHLPPPLQMSDAAATNTDHPFETIIAYCLNHARGNFDDIQAGFPVECRRVLDLFSTVYKHEKDTKCHGMNAQERLLYHQTHSREPMAELFAYLTDLLKKGLIEDASSMATAARYVLKRKEQLTRFLEIPGAPLDSNVVERALKHAVLIRKNSLFYRNEVSAYNAGILMTLAATCVHNQQDPLHYFTALLDNEEAVKADPDAWLPWNYPSVHGPGDG